MPPHLAFNAHILHGYRPAAAGAAGDGTPRCGRAARAVASSFTLHNETLNIWTHGVAAALAARALAAGAPDAATAGLLVCGFACFALSVTYHACMPATRGPRGYGTLLAADLAGVWAVNAGLSLVTTVQVGACWPTAAVAAAVAAPALAAAAALACATTPRARAAAFGLQAAVRSTTPMLAAAAGMSAWNADDVLAHLGLEAAVLIAAVLNVVRLPERMWPGSRVAAMASGHTIMHVVVAAVFFSFYARSAERARAPPTCGRGWAPN